MIHHFFKICWTVPKHAVRTYLPTCRNNNLTNLQVTIGGQNVLNSTLNMTYENFLEQVNLAEQLTSSDFGVSTGLISQGYWEQSKWYFVNVERGNIADKLQPRNINVIFTNNSNVAIDLLIFIHILL